MTSLLTCPGLWTSIYFLKVRAPPSLKLWRSDVTQLSNKYLCQQHGCKESCQVLPLFSVLLLFLKWNMWKCRLCDVTEGSSYSSIYLYICNFFQAEGNKWVIYIIFRLWSFFWDDSSAAAEFETLIQWIHTYSIFVHQWARSSVLAYFTPAQVAANAPTCKLFI